MSLPFHTFIFELYDSIEGLSPYYFYSRFKASPFEVSSYIVEGIQQKILVFDNALYKISLTQLGRKKALNMYYEKVRDNRCGREIQIPELFKTKALDINVPYSTTDINELTIKSKERTSTEEASRFRFRVKAE